MATWWQGRKVTAEYRAHDALPIRPFVERCGESPIRRIPGTAIFVTANVEKVPNALLHALKHFKSLHERVIVMTVKTEDVPHVGAAERLETEALGNGFYMVRLHYGFMDHQDVPRALKECPSSTPLKIDWMDTSVIVGREKVIADGRSPLPRWRKRLFILLRDLALDATEFLGIPPNRVVELGGQIEI
jgi:KUP system potassium uptake protein